ncbi:MAG: ATP-binding cassette domain-containing protein, partial [Paludibacter sp.]
MKKTKLIPTLLAILFIAIVWQIISWQIGYPTLFPSLVDLVKQVFALFTVENFLLTVSTTIIRGIFGFTLAFIFGFILATIATFSSFWRNFFHPIIVITRSIPVISFVLIAILWFSPPYLPVFIAIITMFPILYQNILTGLEQTDIKWIEMAKAFGKSPYQRFVSIYLPAAKSIIFDGISTAMGFGWRAIIIGEVLAQPLHGIGTSMKQAQAFINVSELIAWTVIAVGVSYLFEGIIKIFKDFHVGLSFPMPAFYIHPTTSKTTHIKSINIQNLDKSFNDIFILKSFSNEFEDSTVICIKGPSGIGKTTLLRLISKLDKPNAGQITFTSCSTLAYSFQDIRLLPWLNVTENIAYTVQAKPLLKQETNNLVGYLLKELELTEEAYKYPHELSGGQQQRVGLARALAARSDVLLLDEPLNGLDNALKSRVIDFLSVWIAIYKPVVVWASHENVKLKELKVREIGL